MKREREERKRRERERKGADEGRNDVCLRLFGGSKDARLARGGGSLSCSEDRDVWFYVDV